MMSKKSMLLNLLKAGKVSLETAATELYDTNTELNRLRVIRLLAAYRHNCSDFYYRVRNGEIVISDKDDIECENQERFTMRMPASLVDSVKAIAKNQEKPYQRLIREWVQERVAASQVSG